MGKDKITFTVESLRQMNCEEGKRRTIYYDKKQPKLACIVSTTGIKTFALHTFDRIRKTPVQRTIGRYPEININHAREISNKLLAQIAEGLDIQDAARAIREEPTIDDLFEQWLIDAKNRIRTWGEAERSYNLHIKPTFGNRKISTISGQQIITWQNELLKTYRQRKRAGKKVTLSKATANRCLALLRTLFYKKASNIENPCKAVKAYGETSRERYLRPDELKAFFINLNDEATSPVLRDLVYLLLLTGARRSNLLSMMWSEIDFLSAVWTIPASKSKNKNLMTVPLVSKAMEILLKRREDTSSIFVFPGPGKSGHLVEPKRAWYSLIKRTGLNDFRLHDLRRTCGSYQAIVGSNLVTIQKSLGHKNLSTTQIYARMDIDPVRKSMEDAAEKMLESILLSTEIINVGGKNEQK
jgi:integrase